MEHEPDGAGTSGVSRGQNQLHFLPEDWQAASVVIDTLLDRLDTGASTQLLIVTSDAEAAAGMAARIATRDTRGLRVVAATDSRRAGRALAALPAHVVTGAPATLVDLLQATAVRLGDLRALVLAWVDDLDGASTRALETLMAEVPKEATRVVIASDATPAVDQLVERYAWRARRLQAVGGEASPPVSVSYVSTSAEGRIAALRRLLDATDPGSAVVITRTAESRVNVETLLRSLGYGSEGSSVRVAESVSGDAELVVLYDLPPTADELRGAVRGAGGRAIALVTPRQVAALRRLAGGPVSPFTLSGAAERARAREDVMRDELRRVLISGQYGRELLAVEPLLSEFDGAEVAAAALRLLETERGRPRAAAAEASSPAMTRLYVNVGEMDNVRPGDLVGAITNEVGIARAEVGRVDVRERHSTVEVSTAVANAVVSKLTGVSIRGRRAIVKVDEDRPGRDRAPGRDRPGRDHPGRDRPGRDRPDRDRPARTRPPRQ